MSHYSCLINYISFFSVGHPIELPKIENPTTEQIDEYHKKFNEGLINLFETHKHKYMKNAETTTLEFC